MKKWEYKVKCYSYSDKKSCWTSVFDEQEAKTLEELIMPLGEEGWELINVTAELAVPLESPVKMPVAAPNRNGNVLEKIRSASGESAPNSSLYHSASGGFDVKTYRAFFKRPKSGGLFG